MMILSWLLDWSIASFILAVYVVCELIFFFLFYCVFLPHCNQPVLNPQEFRTYKEDRRLLLLRITRRIERTCQSTGKPFLPTYSRHLHAWFHYENKNDIQGNTYQRTLDDKLPCKDDMDDLLAWGFFGLDEAHMEPWMVAERDRMYEMLRDEFGIIFPPGKRNGVKPMRLSLDQVEPAYRPMAVYALFGCVETVGKLVLWLVGFRPYAAKSGLRYWYRPQRASRGESIDEKSLLPALFFHGIAPGGLAPYLPLILCGLGRDGRALFLFENPAISFQVCFRSPTEQETIDGVAEALEAHLPPGVNVSAVGHSFGTCQVTWLLHSSQAHRLRQIVVLDPVTILLSDPDVITNFLYTRGAGKMRGKRGRLGIVANELFIEHYLRRQFAPYNGELWLEDVPMHCKVVVGLSEHDDILNFQKVKQEVEIHMGGISRSMKGDRPTNARSMKLVEWSGASHAQCVMRPDMWQQIRVAMRRQEHLIRKETSVDKKTE